MRQRQRQRQARRADAAGVADLPIDFGGKLSAATHTLATVVECFEGVWVHGQRAWGG
jgi:hypothetical protein